MTNSPIQNRGDAIRAKIKALKYKEGVYTVAVYKDFPVVIVHSQKEARAGLVKAIIKMRHTSAAQRIRNLRRDKDKAWSDLFSQQPIKALVKSAVNAEMNMWFDLQERLEMKKSISEAR